ncbi:hypothetical protein [Klenkia brasiliensis]|uniref:Fibronectin type-III domain-containing protein n=1 Tax=Klenkia brasiliensis TaxID=333142 RepID=A0A1G7LPS4_9ACTN|nr:hypothetical protein [Klenkia brasiliensis]SDF51532.1 hypothetical protein SAMN05660324_0348 [Klenkia brasiliensis]
MTWSTVRRSVAPLVLALLLLGLAAPPASADSAPAGGATAATPVTVSADPLPTVQINGVAWSQVVVGTTVYVAGKFTRARPAGAAAGTQETVRNNLLAYDIRTGQLITSFAPDLNAQALVVTASPDGSRLYVGGDFTVANGQSRLRVAAYDTATGALVTGFAPAVYGQVRALAATASTVYAGGSVSSVGSVGRNRLAALDAATGALLPWAPQPGVGSTAGNRDGSTVTSNAVLALVVTGGGSQVVAAGRFDSLNGTKATGVGALDPVTGATRSFAVNRLITNQGVNSAVWSLSTDGTTVWGSGYDYYGPGNLEGAFAARADGGGVVWVDDCHGDTYSTFAQGGALYVATHAHDCGNIGGYPEQNPRVNQFGLAFSQAPVGTVGTATLRNRNFTGQPAPALQTWFPTFASGTVTGQYQAGWNVTGNAQYVVYGGEFPRVNGTAQQGLVRFAVPSAAPNRVGPAAQPTPTASQPLGGAARVSWQATSDQDNGTLVYRVHRDGSSTPAYQVSVASTWWNRPTTSWTDTGLADGQHTYRVSATDPFGNTVTSAPVTITTTGGTTVPPPPTTTALAQDSFTRTSTAGWGSADTGGAWTVGSTATTSVDGSRGVLALPAAGRSASASLAAVQATDVTVQASFATSSAATGGGTYGYLAARQSGNTAYRVSARFTTTGAVEVALVRQVAGVETVLGRTTLTGATSGVVVRLDASGTGTTSLQVTAWPRGGTAPAAPQLTATDTQAELQRAGAVGVAAYLSGSATAGTQVLVDDLWAGPVGTRPAAG